MEREENTTVPATTVEQFIRDVFVRLGMSSDDAQTSAELLVWPNLRGVDAQGVQRFPWYVQLVHDGLLNPSPKIETLRERRSTILVEADRAFGPVVARDVSERAMEKAKESGICWCVIRNHAHLGALGYYTEKIARQDMVGIVAVSALPNMVPFGAKTAGLHNSSLSIGVPAFTRPPLILDMATSVVAGGKIYYAADMGLPIPEGWAVDSEGRATTDPTVEKALLPVGGPKGSGLAMMLTALTSTIANNRIIEPLLDDSRLPRRHNQNSVIAVIDIAAFTELSEYKQHIDHFIECIKALPKADGVEEIFVPGEIEHNTYLKRKDSGIPFPTHVVRRLHNIGTALGITSPF